MRITLNQDDIIGILQERFRYAIVPGVEPEVHLGEVEGEGLQAVILFSVSPFSAEYQAGLLDSTAGARAAGPVVPASSDATQEAPRRRGRPPGSKNKATLAAATNQTSDTILQGGGRIDSAVLDNVDDNNDAGGDDTPDISEDLNDDRFEALSAAADDALSAGTHPDFNPDPPEDPTAQVEEPAQPAPPTKVAENPFAKLKSIAPPQILPIVNDDAVQDEAAADAAAPAPAPFNPSTKSLFRAGNAPAAPAADVADTPQTSQEASESADETAPAPVPAQTRSLFASIHQMAQKRSAGGSGATVSFSTRKPAR